MVEVRFCAGEFRKSDGVIAIGMRCRSSGMSVQSVVAGRAAPAKFVTIEAYVPWFVFPYRKPFRSALF
jgi:hypothetical protein